MELTLQRLLDLEVTYKYNLLMQHAISVLQNAALFPAHL